MTEQETVFVIQGQNRHKAKYHDGPNACQSSKAGEQFEEITMEQAERRDLELCKWCAGEVDTSGQDLSYQNYLQEKAQEYAAGGD